MKSLDFNDVELFYNIIIKEHYFIILFGFPLNVSKHHFWFPSLVHCQGTELEKRDSLKTFC